MTTYGFTIEAENIGEVEGTLSFNGGNCPPAVNITSGIRMSLENLKKVESFLGGIVTLSRCCGKISNIEIKEKT